MKWTDRLDQWIRFLMYVLIFWMPYSQAVIETTVIMALVVWIIKRIIGFVTLDKTRMSWSQKFSSFVKNFRPPDNGLNTPIFVFLGLCVVSTIVSDHSADAFHGLISKTCEWFVIYLLVCESFKKHSHVRTAITVLMVTVVALALDSFLQYYITHRDIFMGRVIEPGARATASFEAPSSLAAVYTIILPLVGAMFFDRTRRPLWRCFLLAVGVIFSWSLVLSFSRGAILGIFMSFFFFMFLYFYHLKQKKVKAYVSLYVAALLIIVMSKVSLGEYSQLGFLNRKTSDSRVLLWYDTAKMIKDRPLFGHGLNTYMKIFNKQYRTKALGIYAERAVTISDYSPSYAHNCYLQIWAETGIFSLMAFLWILFRLSADSIGRIKIFFAGRDHFLFVSVGLLSGLFAFLVQSFFDTNFYSLQLSSYFWFMAGIQMAINRCTIENEGNVPYVKT